MLEKVYGIVLRTVKFNDAKLIVDMFTLGHGRQSFVASISHSRKSKGQMAFWAPLSMVEFDADIRPTSSQMAKPKDVRLYNTYTDIPYNPMKSTVALYLAELLSASLRSETVNVPLYRFVETSLMWFDNQVQTSSLANFHIVFAFRLTRFLGIYPNLDPPSETLYINNSSIDYKKKAESPIFDMVSATFTYLLPKHNHLVISKESPIIIILSRLNYSSMHLLRLTRQQRSRMLEQIMLYYRLHIPSFPELKSIGVLNEVFA